MEGYKLCGRVADKLTSKGYGRRDGPCLILAWEEALFLAEKNTEGFDFKKIFESATEIDNFDILFFVYRDLKARGYVISIRDGYYDARKSVHMPVYPVSDMDFFYFDSLVQKELPLLLAIVDGDGDITYYMIKKAEPEGSCSDHVKIQQYKIAGKRVFMLKSQDTKSFGKKEDKFVHFSNLEAKYLAGADVNVDKNVYEVYRDLRNRGLVVKSGFKYGTHFRVYEKTVNEHSRYLVHVVSEREELQKLSRAVRVAHGVRKELLLARTVNGKIKYLAVSWIRP